MKCIQCQIERLLDDQKEYELKIEALERENKKLKLKNIDLDRFLEWDHGDVLEWILSLENGRYAKYEKTLKKSLAEEEVTGANFVDVETSDVKDWGIKSFNDKKALVQSIRELIQPTAGRTDAFGTQQ